MNDYIKSEDVVSAVADATDTTVYKTNMILNALSDVIAEAIVSGKDVKIKGIGTIRTVEHAGTRRFNIGTGRVEDVPSRRVVELRPASKLRIAADGFATDTGEQDDSTD